MTVARIYSGFGEVKGLKYVFVGEPVAVEKRLFQGYESAVRALLERIPHANAAILFEKTLSYDLWATQMFACPIKITADTT